VVDGSDTGLKLLLDQPIPLASTLILELTVRTQQRGQWYGADPFALSLGRENEQTVMIESVVCHCNQEEDGSWSVGVLLHEDTLSENLSLLREYLEEHGYYEI
jgi:hypothetical protein